MQDPEGLKITTDSAAEIIVFSLSIHGLNFSHGGKKVESPRQQKKEKITRSCEFICSSSYANPS